MFRLKACPRCKGDLIINQERHVRYEECLQCGYEREVQSLVKKYSAIGAMFKADSMAVEGENE
jgi:Zn ribbon nucleic-acid-binding protein